MHRLCLLGELGSVLAPTPHDSSSLMSQSHCRYLHTPLTVSVAALLAADCWQPSPTLQDPPWGELLACGLLKRPTSLV
jgi:hypothetical protein